MADRIYYNITVNKDTSLGGNGLAMYNSALTQSVNINPKDYYLAVHSFALTSPSIPIFVFQDNTYSVELEYNGGFSGRTYLTYIPTSPLVSTSDPSYYYVYTYSIMLQMVNNALSTAFSALPSSPMGSSAPYFTFDSSTGKFTLVVQTAFYDETLPLPINIYMNKPLWRFFNGITILYYGELSNGRDVKFKVYNKYNNTSGANYLMDSEYDARPLWYDSKGIIFTSSTLPTVPEFINTSSVSGVISSLNILTKYDFLYSPTLESKPVVYNYNPTQYKYIDLDSTTAIN